MSIANSKETNGMEWNGVRYSRTEKRTNTTMHASALCKENCRMAGERVAKDSAYLAVSCVAVS
eukprot:35084-Hanusia_phi.AAC.1